MESQTRKSILRISTTLLVFTVCFLLGRLVGDAIKYHNQPKIDLPEEYKAITPDTPIQGWIDKDSVLHIEFVHKK